MNKKVLIGLSILMGTATSGCSKKENINTDEEIFNNIEHNRDEDNSKDLNTNLDKETTTNLNSNTNEDASINLNSNVEKIDKSDLSSNLEEARRNYIEGEKPLYIDGILVVNKEFGIPRNFASGLNQEVIEAFNQMKKDAELEGIIINIRSGFRDYDTQTNLFNTYAQRDGIEKANRYSAKPGHSEHETGLTIDITDEYNNRSIGDWFNETKQAKWLYENAYKYGFILRYPKGKEDITGYKYESWHYRYIGTEHSKNFAMNDLTLEEYLKIVNTN